MKELVWSDEALLDLDRLDTFLRNKSSTAASRAYLAILEAVERLRDFPMSGRVAPDRPGYREILVPFSSGGYVVLYQSRDYILIVAVRHQREDDY